MENFEFKNPTQIVFGRDQEQRVGALCAPYAKTVLLHFGGKSAQASGLLDLVRQSLAAAGIRVLELGGVLPNPRLSLVHEGVALCRTEHVDLVLAVGGGSVIDSAKAIAMGVNYEGDVWDFFAGKAVLKKALPVATVLTIPAAGSESSNSTVITKEEGLLKRGFGSDLIFPVFSILNPALCFSLSAFQGACGAADIMAHLMERYFTNTPSVNLTDRLIEGALRNIIDFFPQVIANPRDYDAWAEVMWTGCLAHNNSLGTGRVGDWASHDIEHELSAIYDVAHGAGLAVVFPAWMRCNYRHDLARFVRFANRVWGVEVNSFDLDATAKEGIKRLSDFFKSIGLPVRLPELGIDAEHLETMARKATNNNTRTLGNFVKHGQAEVLAVYREAL